MLHRSKNQGWRSAAGSVAKAQAALKFSSDLAPVRDHACTHLYMTGRATTRQAKALLAPIDLPATARASAEATENSNNGGLDGVLPGVITSRVPTALN